MEKVLATIGEASAAIGMGRSSIYRLLNEGRLAGVKVGKRRLIVAASVFAFVDTLRAEADENT